MSEVTELDPAGAAKVLGLTDRQVRNLVDAGELLPDRVKVTPKRKFYFFKPETVEALARRRRGEDTAPTVSAI
jgi:hypothetical protein